MSAVSTTLDLPGRTAGGGYDFCADIRGFTYNGAVTIEEDWGDVPFFFNEFWTARQRQAHRLHEVSYRACFKPQLPQFFIERLTRPGERVYDPFMGRGTTLLQAALMQRFACGNDVNPLSELLVRPRLNAPSIQDVRDRLASIDWSRRADAPEELLVFYHPGTLQQICALRSHLIERADQGRLDAVDAWIRMVAINRLTGHSTGFFSVYTLPPNQAVSVESQRRINAKRRQTPPLRSVPDIIAKKTRALLADGPIRGPGYLVATASSAHTPQIPSASVALVVTSPPFLDVVQYAQDNWLRCWFAGIDVGQVQISMHKKVEAWGDFVRDTFRELGRVVRPGGHVAFEVGEVRNGSVQLEKVVIEAVAGLPFRPTCVVINVQEFTKTANCWGVSNNRAGTNTNRIVLLERV